MRFTKRGKVVILILSLGLNLLIRIPSLSHSYGIDSYTIRGLANSIALFGEARYWLNTWSIGGFYPYSYASSGPFMLAGVKELTGLSNEMYPLVFAVIIGLLSFFTALLLAGELVDSDFYRYIVAIVYSLSPGILVQSSWNVSTRGLFIVLFPLLPYMLIKTRSKPLKFVPLILLLEVLLAATHHFFWFTLPVIFGYLFLRVVQLIAYSRFFGSFVKTSEKTRFLSNLGFMGLFAMALGFPFFSYFFIKGSKYTWIIRLIEINARYSGPLVFLALAGFLYMGFKDNKSFNEWFILLVVLGISPFVYNATYTHFINIIFVTLMVAYAFNNLGTIYKNEGRKIFLWSITFFLVGSVLFSSFYQHNRTHRYRGAYDWYMLESTYEAGIWVGNHISLDNVLLSNHRFYNPKNARMSAIIGGFPRFVRDESEGLAYGFIDPSKIKVKKNDPLSTSFYQDNPYIKVEPRESVSGLINWMSERDRDIDSSGLQKRFGVSYIVEDTRRRDAMTQSLHAKKDAVYSGGEIKIWNIKK